MILPESWAAVLQVFAPVFARRGTFRMFMVLATGMVAQTGRRSVVGMLAGAGMAQKISFHAACRFFSHSVWDIDRLGLAAAGLIVRSLLGPDEPIVVAVDDTLFKTPCSRHPVQEVGPQGPWCVLDARRVRAG
jgi:SRSO17 transposase